MRRGYIIFSGFKENLSVKNKEEKQIKTTRVTLTAPDSGGSDFRRKPEPKRSAVLSSKPEAALKSKSETKSPIELKRKPEAKNSADLKGKPEVKISTDLKPKPAAKRSAGSIIAELFFSVLLLGAICALRPVQVYASNVGSVSFSEVSGPLLVYMGISVAFFALLRIFLRKPYFACIFVAIGTFIALNFSWLIDLMRLFLKESYSATIGGLALFVVILTGFFFLLRFLYKKNFPGSVVARILSITFTGLVLMNVVMAFAAMGKPEVTQVAAVNAVAPVSTPKAAPSPSIRNTDPEKDPAAGTTKAPEPLGKPNVYFFILDEYGTFDLVSNPNYYNYDNSVFYNYLKAEGFNISKTSFASDNETLHCAADLTNLQYISRHFSDDDCEANIKGAPFFKAFSDMGYTEAQLSTNNGFFNGVSSLDPNLSQGNESLTMDGEDAEDLVNDNSISDAFQQILGQNNSDTEVDTAALNQWNVYPSDYIRNTKEFKQCNSNNKNLADAVLSIFDYYDNPSTYANKSPHVTFSYIMSPHVPFIFNEYGGIIPNSQSRNWEDTKVYLSQYKFITKRTMEAVDSIIKNDPQSIIIVMSDHGIRYHADCKLKHTFVITDKDSCRIMNAVYIKGQTYNIEGLSGINTLRYILSLYDGQNYPPIDDNITSASPDCLKGFIPKSRHS